MKLCHIVPSLAQQHGGPSKSVRALCRALATAGHEVDLFATSPEASATGERQQDGNLRITTFRRDWPGRMCPSSGLRRAVQTSAPDVIHHHAIWLRTLHYARQAADRTCPLVISPRGMMSRWAWHHHRWRKQMAMGLIHPRALNAAAGWHVTSEDEERDVHSLGYGQPSCIAPNGVDRPDATEIETATAHWRSVCPSVADRPVALFYSRFHPKKRVLELIDLWLAQAPPDWLLLLVGIPEAYTPEMLERYVVQMSGAGRVRVFNGISQPAPYSIASLFLLPSHNENFGLAIAEAMAHGVPAMVTDTTPWSELNRHDLGWCVPWADFGGALRAATSESTDGLKARGQQAQEWVLRHYSWSHTAKLLADFYRTLIGKPRNERNDGRA